MKTRLAGVGLILVGVAFGLFFIYLPVRDPSGFVGSVPLKALVFVPLAVVTGAAFIVGGPPVLGAFQARPKSRGQMALVLSILIGSGVLTGLGYWQLKTRWLPPPAGPEIIREREFRPKLPEVSRPQVVVPKVEVPNVQR